ncbi:MAG TPA: ATP-grasp domain-containing protein [Acidimicrobiales bacterium]|nr:ATP-grasp domain-containing protein [Acidimicrobiales bacterium]
MARLLLLIPSATYRARDFLDAARSLGVEVVIGTEEAQVLGDLMGAHSLEVPLGDCAEAARVIVAYDGVLPIDAVVAVDDGGTLVAAEASAQLGLRHNPPDAVAATRDKLAMRTRLAGLEVPQPAFAPLPADAGREEIAAIVGIVGLPCVIKPTTLAGSQGVLRADTMSEAQAVAERVRRIATAAGVDPGAALLVERFAPGPEVAVEGLMVGGELRALAVFDKPDPLEGPAFEETIYVTPSRLGHGDLTAVLAATSAATVALGLTEGPVHAEVRVLDGRASVIEVAARTIGGLCSRTLSFSTGRSLEELVIAHALGLALGETGARGASGVLMVPIPRAGTLVGVNGQAEARQVPGVIDLEITIATGRAVAPVPEGNRYLGFVFARDSTPARVEGALRRAWACLEVRVEDGVDDSTP